MIESHPFSINPLTGAVTMWHTDHATGMTHIETKLDVQPMIDTTRELFKESASDWKGDLHHVASIPPTLLADLEKKGIMTRAGRILDEKALRKWLNDADNRAFRTRPGRI